MRVELSTMSGCTLCYSPWCYLVMMFVVVWCLMTSAISCPLWCAFTSPVRTECGMFVMYCMQCCMSVSVVL